MKLKRNRGDVPENPQDGMSDLLVKSQEEKKNTHDGLFFALRVFILIVACGFAIAGLYLLTNTTDEQVAAQTVTTESVRPAPVRKALLLCSQSESDPKVGYQRSGVMDVMNRSSVSCDVEYLDADEGIAKGTIRDNFANLLNDRITANGGYDVAIIAGDDALDFALEYRDDVFADIPVAYFGVNNKALVEKAQSAEGVTGITQTGLTPEILKTACSVVPGEGPIVVIQDGSLATQGLYGQMSDLVSGGTYKSRSVDVWDASAMSREELGERLSDLSKDSIVLLLGSGVDASGASYQAAETTHFICEQSDAPVFTPDFGVGDGVCGSAFIDVSKEAGVAASMAVDLLNGKSAAEVGQKTTAPSNIVFDVEALETHGISADGLPVDATLVNEPLFSSRSLRPYITAAVFLILAAVLITIFGVIGYRRSLRANQAILASRNDLQYRLYHDLLTELPNRHALEQVVSNPATAKGIESVVQLDIESFADINDSYGHEFGNKVIQEMGHKLREVPAKFLVRSGGDVFVLAFDHTLNPCSKELVQIRNLFAQKMTIGDNSVDLSIRVGVANRDESIAAKDLVVYSDMATHEAKSTGEKVPVFYNKLMKQNMEQKLEISGYLKRAIADESFAVLYQPQVDTKTCDLYGYEALVRLEGNAYYPDQFIPVAEMSGLVAQVDRIVTKKVIAQLGAWRKEGKPVGVASINFSAAQLKDKGYFDFLKSLLKEYDVPANLIKIEFTESMLVGSEKEADDLFTRLRAMGITLALDDFGTGYSSLYRMTSMPVDFVKLDKSLVDTFMVPGKEGFIDNITKLIHGLGKRIVVEGVETREQYDICRRLGCDVIQGYFFSRPIPGSEIETFDAHEKVPDLWQDQKKAVPDRTRNRDWDKYDRDASGRWRKRAMEA